MRRSDKPYFKIPANQRDLNQATPGLVVGWWNGGAVRGPQTVQQVRANDNVWISMRGGTTNYLNLMLDTAGGPNPHDLFPSWGTIEVLDITPRNQ